MFQEFQIEGIVDHDAGKRPPRDQGQKQRLLDCDVDGAADDDEDGRYPVVSFRRLSVCNTN